MNQKTYTALQQQWKSNLIAIYEYGMIPIFILKNSNFIKLETSKKYLEWESFIMLNKEDIINGTDIFALKFLHIQHHAKRIIWIPIFEKLKLKKEDIRFTLEADLRNKLIQLRESYLSTQKKKKFIEGILPAMEPIREWAIMLKNKKIPETLQEKTELVDKLYDCNWKVFYYDQTDNKTAETIQEINRYLETLCNKINNFTS